MSLKRKKKVIQMFEIKQVFTQAILRFNYMLAIAEHLQQTCA